MSASKKIRFAKTSVQDQDKITDWSLCVVCQEQSPDDILTNPSPTGYETLATNLTTLHELDSLPQDIDISFST